MNYNINPIVNASNTIDTTCVVACDAADEVVSELPNGLLSLASDDVAAAAVDLDELLPVVDVVMVVDGFEADEPESEDVWLDDEALLVDVLLVADVEDELPLPLPDLAPNPI